MQPAVVTNSPKRAQRIAYCVPPLGRAPRHQTQRVIVVRQRSTALPCVRQQDDVVSGHVAGHVRGIGKEVLRKERHVGMLGH